jgi:hypothetical protein
MCTVLPSVLRNYLSFGRVLNSRDPHLPPPGTGCIAVVSYEMLSCSPSSDSSPEGGRSLLKM